MDWTGSSSERREYKGGGCATSTISAADSLPPSSRTKHNGGRGRRRGPVNGDTMPFGKHKGKRLSELPVDYLDWLFHQDWLEHWPGVFTYVRNTRHRIEEELAEFGR